MKRPTPYLVVSLMVLTFLFTTISIQAQTADYGDAPDGGTFGVHALSFPSLNASACPLHTSAATSTFHIAKSWGSVPDMEPDSKQVNQDIDNGQPFIFINLLGIPAPTKVTVPITTTASHNPGTILYLNLAIDVDNDYDFDNSPDNNWVLHNYAFSMPADTTLGIVTPNWFGFGNDLLLFPVWLRATVTDVPVPGNWNIGGPGNIFGNGETEDWFYTFGTDPDAYPPEWVNPPHDPMDPDTMKHKKPPHPPAPNKCADLKYPKVVYIKCNQVKCVWFEVKNCGSDSLKDVTVKFTPDGGTPLPNPPTVQPAGAIPFDLDKRGDKKRFQVCATGWPCGGTQEGVRWARYSVKLSYDPDGLYWEDVGTVTFGNDEDPITDSTYYPHLAAEPVDTSDYPLWEATINQPFSKNLMVWTGYNNLTFLRWITGQPKLDAVYLPPWASLDSVTANLDTTWYRVTGTPGDQDYKLDSAVFRTTSYDPTDSLNVQFYNFTIPIIVNNVNTAPVLTQTFNSSYALEVNSGDAITQTLTATDADITNGKRDTLFISYYILDTSADTVYTPDNPITYTYNGGGSGSFSWTPSANDVGTYELVAVAWDYAFEKDTSSSTVTVTLGQGIHDGIPLHYVLEQNAPNPFSQHTSITFGVPTTQQVSLEVYDIEGRLVTTLYNKTAEAGYHTVQWNGAELEQGIYFYQLKAGDYTAVLRSVKLE